MAKDPSSISDADMPQYVRRCWQHYREATDELRRAEKESRGFWIGGDKQWEEGVAKKRRGNSRPVITINRCAPAVAPRARNCTLGSHRVTRTALVLNRICVLFAILLSTE